MLQLPVLELQSEVFLMYHRKKYYDLSLDLALGTPGIQLNQFLYSYFRNILITHHRFTVENAMLFYEQS